MLDSLLNVPTDFNRRANNTIFITNKKQATVLSPESLLCLMLQLGVWCRYILFIFGVFFCNRKTDRSTFTNSDVESVLTENLDKSNTKYFVTRTHTHKHQYKLKIIN